MVPEQPELPVALGALATLTDAPRRASAEPAYRRPARHGPPADARSPARPVMRVPGVGVAAGVAAGQARRVRPASRCRLAAYRSAARSAAGWRVPVSAVPVSGDPGRAWTGQPAAHTSGAWTEQPSWAPGNAGQAGQHPGRLRAADAAVPASAAAPGRRGSRATTIVAIAASVALLVLAGATIWFVRNALGTDPDGRSQGSGATNAPAPARQRRAREHPARRPRTSPGARWTAGNCSARRSPSATTWTTTTSSAASRTRPRSSSANYAVADLLAADPEAVKSDPTVQSTCNETAMTARSADPNKTVDWTAYIQPLSVNGVAFIYCLAGPRPEGTTTTGPAFKLG